MPKLEYPFNLTPNIKACVLRVAGCTWVFVSPHRVAYGHAIIDLAQAASLAKKLGARLFVFRRRSETQNAAAYLKMTSRAVPVTSLPFFCYPLIGVWLWDLPWWMKRLRHLRERKQSRDKVADEREVFLRDKDQLQSRWERLGERIIELGEQAKEVAASKRPLERKVEKGKQLREEDQRTLEASRKQHELLLAEREAVRKERDELREKIQSRRQQKKERIEKIGEQKVEIKKGQLAYDGYFQRRLLHAPPRFELSASDSQRALQLAKAAGLSSEKPIAVIHARESGYKLQAGSLKYERRSYLRNVNIRDYALAIDFLIEEGYQVVRIGDPSMRPMNDDRLLDLACGSHRHSLLELWCLLSARLFLVSESGPQAFPWLHKVPHLIVGSCELLAIYGICESDFQLPKLIWDKADQRFLEPMDLLEHRYVEHWGKTTHYEYYPNTPEQIRDGAIELHRYVSGQFTPSEAQLALRKKATDCAVEYAELPRMIKWGADDGFLGEGWVSAAAFDGAKSFLVEESERRELSMALS